jgi:hypothetical protein
MELKFFDRFSRDIPMSNFMKIRPVGAELFHAYRRTDRNNEAKSRFSQFADTSKNLFYRSVDP